MQSEKDPKKSAGACLESTKLDPDFYRLGHTKARIKFLYNNFSPFHHILSFMIHHKVFKISTKMNFFWLMESVPPFSIFSFLTLKNLYVY